MSYRASDRSPRREEKDVNMWINLRHDGESDVEMKVQRFEWDISSQRSILPLMAERIRREGAVLVLLHKDDWVEDTRNSGGGKDSGPNDTVWCSDVIREDSRRVWIRRNAGHVQDAAGPLVGFSKCHTAPSHPGATLAPLDRVKTGSSLVPSLHPGQRAVLRCFDAVSQCRDKQFLELLVCPCTQECCDQSTS